MRNSIKLIPLFIIVFIIFAFTKQQSSNNKDKSNAAFSIAITPYCTYGSCVAIRQYDSAVFVLSYFNYGGTDVFYTNAPGLTAAVYDVFLCCEDVHGNQANGSGTIQVDLSENSHIEEQIILGGKCGKK